MPKEIHPAGIEIRLGHTCNPTNAHTEANALKYIGAYRRAVHKASGKGRGVGSPPVHYTAITVRRSLGCPLIMPVIIAARGELLCYIPV